MCFKSSYILQRYADYAWSFIDQWPKEWLSISPATQLIELTESEIDAFLSEAYDEKEQRLLNLTNRLTKAMNGDVWFIRLNSRSPKDASGEKLPITSSAKQAMQWLQNSQLRVMQDMAALRLAELPIFICLREVIPNIDNYEYRCVIENGALKGVVFTRTRTLVASSKDSELLKAIISFFRKKILPYASENCFVLDIYARSLENIKMIEINPLEGADTFGIMDDMSIENEFCA